MSHCSLILDRVIITNIPSIEAEGRDWRDFVQKLNPGLFQHHGVSDDVISSVSSQQHEEDVVQAIDLLRATLEPESVKRITARDALYHPFLKGEGDVSDDNFFPHPFGRGVCGMYHFKDSVSEDLCVIDHQGMRKVNAGEGIAIGYQPCEFHKNYPDFS